ncbi:MAG: hypothetical protein RLZZ450_4956 [Pseudomonadota bacterium]|jgi:hypothetical protein
MITKLRTTVVALGLTLFTGCAAESISEDDPALNQIRQEAVASSNGLRAINGLRSINGLISANGLTTTNGLRTRNGLRTLNGLRTINGLRTRNGLDTDCTGKTAGVDCTGEPDGLLDNSTGLMSSEDGVTAASYLIRCALPASDSLRIKDFTGGLVVLSGELGLAPSWKDGECDGTCQERISACLMAFTNGDGEHVNIEMAAPFVLGTSHSYRYQEASFYGNIFVDPPQAFYCVGKDFAENGLKITLLEERSCTGYNERDGKCPYKRVGYCESAFSLSLSDNTLRGDKKCTYAVGSDTAKSCKDSSGNVLSLLSSGKTWANPITTFRQSKN